MFRQAFVGFAAVLACYWTYWFLAVPLIEPNVDQRMAQSVSDEQIERARTDVTERQRELARFFNPEDWEAKGPKFINSGQMTVLFDKLATGRDGTLELEPCTLLFFARENPQQQGQPVIMRTAKATLRFDKPVNLRSADFKDLNFLGGEIQGAVRIVQRESAPGKGDDLEISTSGVKMDAERIYTPEAVQFRMGRSRGFGSDLEIRLASSESGARGTALRGMSVSTVELKRDVRMRLEMGDGPLAGQPATAATQQANSGAAPQDETIEIKCAGSFVFDMPKYAASFADNVDVFRIVPQGESDQLNCQLLTVYFMRSGEAPEGAAPETKGQRNAASQVRLIEARGNPVTIRSPSRAMYARCNGLDYLPGDPGEPGSMVAFGPGVLQGQMPLDKDGRPTGEFAASWARELRFEPDGPHYRAALHGAATINIGTLGEIKADEVFAWLSKKPAPAAQAVARVAYFQGADPAAQQAAQLPAPQQPGMMPGGEQWQIERLLARKYQDPGHAQTQDVTINSPQFQATTGLLEAVVVRPQAAGPAVGGPVQAQPEKQRQQPANPDEKFILKGRTVKIQLVPQGEQLAIAAATVEQSAELKQIKFAAGLEKRMLLVSGDRLHVVDAQTPGTRITITGQPGFVEADGMSLWGLTIDVDKAANRLWITGPGKLMLPMNQDLDGKQLARAQQLTVQWKTGMNFQSDTAVFSGAVEARSSQQVVNTETLEAKLNRAIDFARPEMNEARPDQRLDLAALRTRGWTTLEGRQLDETGAQTSYSHMGVNDLSLERGSGDIAGNGPGWVRHVSRGAPPALDPAAVAGRQQAAAPPAPPANEDQLTYLYVTFRRGLTGNLNNRAVKFFDQTKTLYGPVDDWNQQLSDKDLDNLGDTGMVLMADALEVREMGKRPESKRGYFELDATGSVAAEGRKFTAHGNRITYAEQNDQLALRGEPAELFMDDERSGQRREMRAARVQYWLKDRRVLIDGASSVGFPLAPAKQAPTPGQPAAAAPPGGAPPFQPQRSASPGGPLPR